MKQRGGRPPGHGGGGRRANITGLSRAGKGRFGKPVQKDAGPEAQRKWLHHCLRTLLKALKTARQFEQRKLKRRLVKVEQPPSNKAKHQQKPLSDTPQPPEEVPGVGDADRQQQQQQTGQSSRLPAAAGGALLERLRLEAQLEAVRIADLEQIAVQVALHSGFPEALVRAAAVKRMPAAPSTRGPARKGQQQQQHKPQQLPQDEEPPAAHASVVAAAPPEGEGEGEGSAAAAAGAAVGDGGGGTAAAPGFASVLAARLQRASCVRRAAADCREEFGRKFGRAILGAQQPDSESADPDADSDSDNSTDDDASQDGDGGKDGEDSEGAEAADEGERPRKRQQASAGAAVDQGAAGVTAAELRPDDPRDSADGGEGRVDGVEPASVGGERVGQMEEQEEAEDSGVIDDAQIDAFLEETWPAAVGRGRDDGDMRGDEEEEGEGDLMSLDSDGSDGSGGDDSSDRDPDGDGDEKGDSAGSFDSKDFDLPAKMGSAAGAAAAGAKRVPTSGVGSGGSARFDAGANKHGAKRQRPAEPAGGGGARAAVGADARPTKLRRGADGKGAAIGGKDGGNKVAGEVAAGADNEEEKGRKKTKKAGESRRSGDPLMDRRGKNRLGQHARRRLYEKMYGTEARHVQEKISSKKAARQDADPDGKNPLGGGPKAKDGKADGRQGPAGAARAASAAAAPAAAAAAPATIAAFSEQLHPSWAARQRQRELLKLQIKTPVAAPKKIKFDDDGDAGGGGGRAGRGAGQGELGGGGGGDGREPGKLLWRAGADGGAAGGRGRGGGRSRGDMGGRGGGAGRGAGGGKRDVGLGAPQAGKPAGAAGAGVGAGGQGGGSDVPLHPSWAARQKQKQQLLSAAPAGKKTVFADD